MGDILYNSTSSQLTYHCKSKGLMSPNQNINDLNSNVTPHLSSTDNSHISLVANGKISTLYEHKGHISILNAWRTPKAWSTNQKIYLIPINLVFLNAAYDMRTIPSTVSVSREYFIIIILIKMRGLNLPIKHIIQFSLVNLQAAIVKI